MKTKLLLCVALLGIGLSSLFGQEKENNDLSNHLITVREYVVFLNEVAASSNANDLYEGTNKQITCRGTLGDYRYEQTTSQGEAPLLLLSWRVAEAYCDWKNSSERPARKREGVDECYYFLQASSEALEQVDRELKSNLLTFRMISTEAKAYQASGEEFFCSSILEDLLEGVFLIAGVGNAITRQPRADELEESTRSTPDIEQQVAMEEVAEVMQEKTRAANKRASVTQEETRTVNKRARVAQEETRTAQAEEGITTLAAETLRKEKETAEINMHIERLKCLSLENKMKANASSGFIQLAYQQSSDFFDEAIEYFGNAVAAISSRRLETSTLWKEAAMYIKEAAEKCKETAQVWYEKDEKPPRSYLAFVADPFFMHARNKKCLAKASEAEIIGKLELAQKWYHIAQRNQQAFVYLKKAVELHTAGKEKERENWGIVGNIFLQKAKKLEKGLNAEEAGRLSVAQGWREAAAVQQQSVAFFKKAAETYTTGREQEAANWKNAGCGFYHAAEKLGKRIEAEETGKLPVAQAWREAAAVQQQSVNFFRKAAEACAAGREQEAGSWKSAGYGFYNAAEKLGKRIEAEEAGKQALAKGWHEAARLQQQSVEFFAKAAEAYVLGREREAGSWKNAGLSLSKASESLEKALEAKKGNNAALARSWCHAVRKCLQAYVCWKTLAETVPAANFFIYRNMIAIVTHDAKRASEEAERLATMQP